MPKPADNTYKTTESTPECTTCGACCFSTNPRYLRLTGDDHERLGELANQLTLFIENRCYMRLKDKHCIALSIKGASFFCNIYEIRPQVCRELMRASPQCFAEIERKYTRAKATLE